MITFSQVPLKMNYPSLTQIKRFKPFTPKFNPVLSMKELSENACLRTPYLRIMKGCEVYINHNNLSPPWNLESRTYPQFENHSKIFNEKILWMIKYTNTESLNNETHFDRNIWTARLNHEIEQENHNIINVLLDTFENFIQLFGDYGQVQTNSFLFKAFLFNPEIPIPLENNRPYTLRDFVSVRPFEDPRIRGPFEYFIHPRYKFFPAFGVIPLIDFTNSRLITFKYLDLTWFNNYNPEQQIESRYKLSYLFPDLFNLWLWRYAAQNLPSEFLTSFQLSYLTKNIFTTNFLPEIEEPIDFGNYSIHLITPTVIYDENLFDELNINISRRLAEKLVVINLANSNLAYRARRIDETCPFHGFWDHNLCSHQIQGRYLCMMNDIIRFPPQTFERNVSLFQKFLRNEYNQFSKYFYWLYRTMKDDDIEKCSEEIDIYIGNLIEENDKFFYEDRSFEMFFGNPPSDDEKLTLIPWSPFFYSEFWDLESKLMRLDNNRYSIVLNDNLRRDFRILLSYFPDQNSILVSLVRSYDPKLLFLIQQQKKALWNIIKHRGVRRDDQETEEERIIRVMKNKLNDGSKRGGVAFFGRSSVRYLE